MTAYRANRRAFLIAQRKGEQADHWQEKPMAFVREKLILGQQFEVLDETLFDVFLTGIGR